MEIARLYIRALPMPPSLSRFPDFLCFQGLQTRNHLIPSLPLVSSSVKKAATIRHAGYKHTIVPATKQDVISVSVTTALHKQTCFWFYFFFL